jgi:hypothetical protein
MRTVSRIALALAASALAAPAHASINSTDVDFEWYANVGRPVPAMQVAPAPRPGYIWSPGHWETHGTRQRLVAGHWIVDDYATKLATHSPGPHAVIVSDSRGDLIVTSPAAYPANTLR